MSMSGKEYGYYYFAFSGNWFGSQWPDQNMEGAYLDNNGNMSLASGSNCAYYPISQKTNMINSTRLALFNYFLSDLPVCNIDLHKQSTTINNTNCNQEEICM